MVGPPHTPQGARSYQLLHPPGGRARGVVVSDEQHLLKVLVSRGVGLGRARHVLTLGRRRSRRRTQRTSYGYDCQLHCCLSLEPLRTKTSLQDFNTRMRGVYFYQLQQEAAEVCPHAVGVGAASVGEANHVQEEPLVDVEVLGRETRRELKSPYWFAGRTVSACSVPEG